MGAPHSPRTSDETDTTRLAVPNLADKPSALSALAAWQKAILGTASPEAVAATIREITSGGDPAAPYRTNPDLLFGLVRARLQQRQIAAESEEL